MTAEAHVPDPGCKCPMPKNVAISQEKRDLGAVERDVMVKRDDLAYNALRLAACEPQLLF